MIARVLPAVLLFAVALAPARAEDTGFVDLRGAGIEASRLTRESLASLPRVEADVVFMTSKGEEHGRYGGVLVWTLLDRAGIAKTADCHGELRRAVLAIGRDGYAILFSVGEIAPEFGNRPIMIALDKDGVPLPPKDGLRLIVPGDKRGARSVRDLVSLEVR